MMWFKLFSLGLIISVFSFLSSLLLLINDTMIIIEYQIIQLNSVKILMVIMIDWMSILYISFVVYISSMVIYYSEEYMLLDFNKNRFLILIMLFVFSMILLIISPNLISILLGWDGLGLVSYCLVIYYQNMKSYSAGMLTILINRLGDVALLISISWMMNFGSWNYIYYLDFMKDDYSMNLISAYICIAAMTKSAQIPFSSWLPAAMAAPTPVSSLVHSSTLVTAGVYLLIRFNNIFNHNLTMFMMFISLMTMFMAGLGANYEMDLKKIIALSTLSQLGFMVSVLFLMEYKLSFFHMLSHALFKATLFMCAGYIIHKFMNCQDIRFMGSLIIQLPYTILIFNICNFSLCGFPFLSGFYSKDLILDILSMNYLNIFMYLIYFISTGLTVSYSIRLMYYTVFGDFNFLSLHMIYDNSIYMMKSMGFMVVFVVIGGSTLNWILFSTPYFICLPKLMKFMTLIVIILGCYLGGFISKSMLLNQLKYFNWFKINFFNSNMWNMPMLSILKIKSTMIMSEKFYLNLDQGWSEYFGSQTIFIKMKNMSKINQFMFYNNYKIFFLILFLNLIMFLMIL